MGITMDLRYGQYKESRNHQNIELKRNTHTCGMVGGNLSTNNNISFHKTKNPRLLTLNIFS